MAAAPRVCLFALLLALPAAVSAKEFALVNAGKPVSCIVVADDAGPVLQHAANELATYLEKVSGARVATASSPTKGMLPITLSVASGEAGAQSPAIQRALQQLRDDGFVLAADATGVRILSHEPVGVLFGV